VQCPAPPDAVEHFLILAWLLGAPFQLIVLLFLLGIGR